MITEVNVTGGGRRDLAVVPANNREITAEGRGRGIRRAG